MSRQAAHPPVRKGKTLEQAEQDLMRVCQILENGGLYQPEEWLLLATLLGEADLAIEEARRRDPKVESGWFEKAFNDLSQATEGFTKPEFARAIGAGVRHRYRRVLK